MSENKLKASTIIIIISMSLLLGISYIFLFKEVPLNQLLYLIRHVGINLGLLLIVILSALGFGLWGIYYLGFKNIVDLWFHIYAIGLGFGILAHIGLLLGMVGLYYKTIAWGLISIGILLIINFLYKNRIHYFQFIKGVSFSKNVSYISIFVLLFLIYTWIYPLITYALIPPVMSDEVAYHMAIPKIFLNHHGITYISFIPYSNWPLETEILFTICLLLSSEILPHLICWAEMIILCLAILIFSKQYFGKSAGIIAISLFASTPMVIHLSGTGLIELPLALYTTLSILAFIKWINQNQPLELYFSSIFGGLAACTKLNAALIPFIIGIILTIYLLVLKKQSIKQTVFQFGRYGSIAFFIVAPWYIKSWIITGNPFWPFLSEIFGAINWDSLGNEYLFGFIQLPNLPISIKNWLFAFFELTVHHINYGPYGIFLGPFYLSLIPFALFSLAYQKTTSRKILSWLGILFGVFYTSWFFQTHQARFLLPILPILAIFIGGNLENLFLLFHKKWFKSFCFSILFLLLIINSWGAYSYDRELFSSRWPYLSGKLGRNAFLSKIVTGYDTYRYANKNLLPDDYVLLALYEVRGYYLDRQYMWANPISQRDLMLEKYSTSDELAKELNKRGFTHIIFNKNKIDQYKYIRYGPQISQLTEKLLKNNASLVYKSGELELYKLIP